MRKQLSLFENPQIGIHRSGILKDHIHGHIDTVELHTVQGAGDANLLQNPICPSFQLLISLPLRIIQRTSIWISQQEHRMYCDHQSPNRSLFLEYVNFDSPIRKGFTAIFIALCPVIVLLIKPLIRFQARDDLLLLMVRERKVEAECINPQNDLRLFHFTHLAFWQFVQ